MGNKTIPGNSIPGNSSNGPPSLPNGTSNNAPTQMQGASGNLAEAGRDGGSFSMGSSWINQGTLIFSQGNIKVYKLSCTPPVRFPSASYKGETLTMKSPPKISS